MFVINDVWVKRGKKNQFVDGELESVFHTFKIDLLRTYQSMSNEFTEKIQLGIKVKAIKSH